MFAVAADANTDERAGGDKDRCEPRQYDEEVIPPNASARDSAGAKAEREEDCRDDDERYTDADKSRLARCVQVESGLTDGRRLARHRMCDWTLHVTSGNEGEAFGSGGEAFGESSLNARHW